MLKWEPDPLHMCLNRVLGVENGSAWLRQAHRMKYQRQLPEKEIFSSREYSSKKCRENMITRVSLGYFSWKYSDGDRNLRDVFFYFYHLKVTKRSSTHVYSPSLPAPTH